MMNNKFYLIILLIAFSKQIKCLSNKQVETRTNENENENIVDLDELIPKENNCALKSNQSVTCSKIPFFCRSVCDSIKNLNFDQNLKQISSFSFGSYFIKNSLTINIKSDLKRIDSDAFNGLVIDTGAVLTINIGSNDVNQFESDYQYYDESDDQIKQIEYSIDSPSTKSDLLPYKEIQENFKNLYLSSNSFRGITINQNAKLIINFMGLNKIEFSSNSLSFIKQSTNSSFMINIENSNHIIFRPECSKLWQVYTENDYYDSADYDSNESSKNNFLDMAQFVIKINSCNRILFEKESFSNLRLFDSSIFQILIQNYEDVSIQKSSFDQLYQQANSKFELNISNGKRLKLSDNLFANLTQMLKAKFMLFISVDESNLCLKENTFSNLKQSFNSSLTLTFSLNNKNSFYINQKSFDQIQQGLSSTIQMYVLKANEFSLDSESFSNINQAKLSLIELWVSKSESNFTIRQRAFINLNQSVESKIKIGFSSPQKFYIQSKNIFYNIISSNDSQVLYDFEKGTNFYLKFPIRPMPRIMLNTDGKQSMEEIAMRLYPNLGRTSRPDVISMNDYLIEDKDFCKIVDIPYDVLVKLNKNTKCSCSVYYLYRILRLVKQESEWLNNTPDCYKDLLNNNNNEINQREDACRFNEMISYCKNINSNQNIDLIDLDKIENVCENDDSFEFTDDSEFIDDDDNDDIETSNDETNQKKDNKLKLILGFKNMSKRDLIIVIVLTISLVLCITAIILIKVLNNRKNKGFKIYHNEEDAESYDNENEDDNFIHNDHRIVVDQIDK